MPTTLEDERQASFSGRAASLTLRVFYDGECPFCSRYVNMLRLRKNCEVQLIDLRAADEMRRELEADGFPRSRHGRSR